MSIKPVAYAACRGIPRSAFLAPVNMSMQAYWGAGGLTYRNWVS